MIEVNKGVARVTNTTTSSYEIILRNKSFVVGDRIRVVITARDEKGRSRQVGGDFFRAKIVSKEVKASSRTDGEIVDLGNGTYHADFTLRWPGRVDVYVMLVLGGHAAFIMDRMQAEFPSRARYLAKFKKGEVLEVTGCDIDHVTNKSNECDFTDKGSVVPWFCEKPKHPNLTCEDWYKRFLTCEDCYVDVKERNPSAMTSEMSMATTPLNSSIEDVRCCEVWVVLKL
ncbi:NXPE family member 3-like [Diadema antillarum]|uniref:NXPE family member 3-like n=1 Tax=Diadema antillarum TaxID=105358 RepID=UPI003A8C2E46